MFGNKRSAEYGVRHLRPSNLNELRKDLRIQLGALKEAASSIVRPKSFGQLALANPRFK